LGLLNPAGALVKILKLIFDFVMFLVERFEQIKDFVMSVYNGISAIASGALGAAQAAVEEALARSLPVVIGLLASLAGLGGIGKTVKNIIGKVAKPVHKVVDKVIAKIIQFVKKLLKKGKSKKGKGKEDVSPADQAKHKQYVDEVLAKLKEGEKKDYDSLRKAKQKQAKQLEKTYKPKLKKGIKLTVQFNPSGEDMKDKDLDFKVVIAPNATTGLGSIPINTSLPPEVKIGNRLEAKATGKIIKIKSFDQAKDQIEYYQSDAVTRRTKLGPIIEQIKSGDLFITNQPVIPTERYLPLSWRPGSDHIRPKLYEAHGWKAVSAAKRAADVPGIIVQVKAVQQSTDPPAAKQQKWMQLKSTGLVEQAASITAYDPATVDYQTDHEPDLAIQWNSSGYDKDDATRRTQVLGPHTLRVITAEANLSKPKHKYKPFIGPNFTSQMAGVGSGAKTIGGQPFLDKSGQPIK
jgi:hypothetical protein